MERQTAKRITYAILAVGAASALMIYALAGDDPGNPLGYDPLTNKKYVHDLRMYGGRANVLSVEIIQWWNGLWHGKHLAYTVAAVTVLAAGAFWVGATLPPLDEGEAPSPHD